MDSESSQSIGSLRFFRTTVLTRIGKSGGGGEGGAGGPTGEVQRCVTGGQVGIGVIPRLVVVVLHIQVGQFRVLDPLEE